jgi:hypothetical protein
MTGRLYDNRDRRTNRRQPDFTGKVRIRGELLRVAGWFNAPSEFCDVKTVSLRFDEEKQAEQAEQARNARDLAKAAEGREQVSFEFLYEEGKTNER